jgi:hypothetical protein
MPKKVKRTNREEKRRRPISSNLNGTSFSHKNKMEYVMCLGHTVSLCHLSIGKRKKNQEERQIKFGSK